MIILRDRHLHAACFAEIDAAISEMLAEASDNRLVAINAHSDPSSIPPGAIVYNLENVGIQVSADAFPEHEIWDFSKGNVALWLEHRSRHRKQDVIDPPVYHMPVGYHRSMERFTVRSWEDRDVDVVLTGAPNERRTRILNELRANGYHTILLSAPYGRKRDDILSRCRLAIGPLFYPDGLFPVLRSAHCAANRLAIIAEQAREAPAWHHPSPVPYDELVASAITLLKGGESLIADTARAAYDRFRAAPLRLPLGSDTRIQE